MNKCLLISFLSFITSFSFSQSIAWEELGPQSLPGVVYDIIIDNNDSDILYCAGPGGLWRSTSAGSYWTQYPFNEVLDPMCIGSISQDISGQLYISTGEPRYGITSGHIGGWIPGRGLYKIEDWNMSPVHLTATVDWDINKLVSDPLIPGKLFALLNNVQNGGIVHVTYNSGDSWNPVAGMASATTAFDLRFSADNDVYLAAGGEIFKSTDSGASFSQLSDPLLVGGISHRRRIACAPSDNDVLYVVLTFNGNIINVVKSEDAGSTWTELSIPSAVLDDIAGEYNSAWWSLDMVVDPLDSERIFLASEELFSYSPSQGIIHLDDALDTEFSDPHFLPTFKLALLWNPSEPDELYITTANGVFKTTNAGQLNPDFYAINSNLRVACLEKMGIDSRGEIIASRSLGPAVSLECLQDVYAAFQVPDVDEKSFVEKSLIDSDFTFSTSLIQDESTRSISDLQSFQPYITEPAMGPLEYKYYALWENYDVYEMAKDSIINSTTISDPDAVLNRIRKTRSLFGICNSIYVSDSDGVNNANDIDSMATLSLEYIDNGTGAQDCSNQHSISATDINRSGEHILIGYPSGKLGKVRIESNQINYPAAAEMIEDGTGGSVLQTFEEYILGEGIIFSSGQQAEPFYYEDTIFPEVEIYASGSASWGTSYISGISIDPADSDRAILSILSNSWTSEKFYYTEDATSDTQTWTPLSGFPGGILVFDVLLVAHELGGDKYAIAATERGIWLYNFTTEIWTQESAGIGNLRVKELKQQPLYESACYVIYAATYGRGVFRATEFTSAYCDTDLSCDIISSVDESDVHHINQKPILHLYPIPASNMLHIELDAANLHSVKTEIYSITGMLIAAETFSASESSLALDITHLATGPYILKVSTKDKIYTEKIIVSD